MVVAFNYKLPEFNWSNEWPNCPKQTTMYTLAQTESHKRFYRTRIKSTFPLSIFKHISYRLQPFTNQCQSLRFSVYFCLLCRVQRKFDELFGNLFIPQHGLFENEVVFHRPIHITIAQTEQQRTKFTMSALINRNDENMRQTENNSSNRFLYDLVFCENSTVNKRTSHKRTVCIINFNLLHMRRVFVAVPSLSGSCFIPFEHSIR